MQRKIFTLCILAGLGITTLPWYWGFVTFYLTSDPAASPYGISKCPDLVQHFWKVTADASSQSPIYVYPPLTAKFFAPLAGQSFQVWHVSWTILNVFLWGLIYILWRRYFSPRFSLHETLVFFLFPAAIDCLRLGQNSFISLLLVLLAGLGLKNDRPFISGLLIGTLFYKPQLVLPLTAILFMLKAYRAVLGSMVASIGWIGLGILSCGWQSYRDWIVFLQSDSYATFNNLASTSIYSLFREAVSAGWPREIKIIWLLLLIVLMGGAWLWISRSNFVNHLSLHERFLFLIPLATVIPLYYGLYDWLLCVPALMLLCRYIISSNQAKISKTALTAILIPNLVYTFGFWVIAKQVPLLFVPVLIWFAVVVGLTRILTLPHSLSSDS